MSQCACIQIQSNDLPCHWKWISKKIQALRLHSAGGNGEGSSGSGKVAAVVSSGEKSESDDFSCGKKENIDFPCPKKLFL